MKGNNFSSNSQRYEPIAIVGMSCRLPGIATNLEGFWKVLSEGQHICTEIPNERFDASKANINSKRGAFVTDVKGFDADFFSIPPSEAIALDPQQRILMECCWHALEDAGEIVTWRGPNKTGVFVGVCNREYKGLLEASPNFKDYEPFIPTGSFLSVIAGRISYTYGFTGPCMTVDTHYSSSLTALHLACQSLHDQECDQALVAGVHLVLTAEEYILFSRNQTLSVDGYSKTFDKNANGFGKGEGCGVIVLKRLSTALANGDRIHAVIRATSVNQDGHSRTLTAPSLDAQKTLIEHTLELAELDASDISYLEAHGTGTQLGDITEAKGIAQVFNNTHCADAPLYVASVKTNIGHLGAASGIAGLIKVVLSLKHQQIPSHLHFQELNPHIDWKNVPVAIPKQLTSWNGIKGKRIAGVSSFGISGTNAHAVLETPPAKEIATTTKNLIERPNHVLVISAKNMKALQDLCNSYIALLKLNTNTEDYLANVGFSANNYRAQFNQRLSVVAKDANEAREKLQAWLDTGDEISVVSGDAITSDQKVAFLFTGQGSQYVGMGKVLYEKAPHFRQVLDKCNEILQSNNYLDKSLLSLLWGENSNLLNETKYTQPALFALEYTLAQLWQSWGVTPQAVIGHSVGEYVAACLAGVFSLEDGLKLISKRAQLMQSLPKNGLMAAINVSQAVITEMLEEPEYKHVLSIAAVNGPKSIVISGEAQAVKSIVAQFAQQNVKTTILTVSHAFHSHLLEPMLNDFAEVFHEIKLSLPKIPLISNVTGQIVDNQIITADYWLKHTRTTVMFAPGIKTLIATGFTNFIEIGPQPVLLGMGQDCLAINDENILESIWLPSLIKDKPEWEVLLQSVGRLWVQGVNVNWKDFDKDYVRQKVELPSYPFQHQDYWVNQLSVTTNDTKPHANVENAQNLENEHRNSTNVLVQQLLGMGEQERREFLANLIWTEVRAILGFKAEKPIELHAGLMELGLSSLLAGELKNRLTKRLRGAMQEQLSQTLIFSYPTIADIVEYLLTDVLTLEAKQSRAIHKVGRVEEPMAIVGMACNFPGGANNLEEFWHILANGVDTISEVPKDRFNIDDFYDPNLDARHKSYTKNGGFIKNVEQFDAGFFRMSASEALALDPQQRLLLEVSWEAFENAGIAVESLLGKNVGVFIGIMSHDYESLVKGSAVNNKYDMYTATGNLGSMAAGRLSYYYGLQGPAIAIDTACSSSLVALHLACESIRNNECDMALVAGVNVIATPDGFIQYSNMHALSPDGRCKTFDKDADGYGRGEGCGVVIISRLSEAENAKNQIYAIIRSSAFNQDGRSSSLTAPNGGAQELLLRQALSSASILPNQISYLEAHGTGTVIGDPIEVRSIGRVLKEGRDIDKPLVIGSVKTNIGHVESAAGIAGIIKTVLALQHKQIPPHLHCKNLNPAIDLESIPACIAQKLTDWQPIDGRRIAGVSSFGISGTNAHAILEEAPPKPKTELPDNYVDRPLHVLRLSAKNLAALKDLAKKYELLLSKQDTALPKYFADLCFSANTGRVQFEKKLVIMAKDQLEAKNQLHQWLHDAEAVNVFHRKPATQKSTKLAMLFGRQGANYVGMGKDLYASSKTFAGALENCAAILNPYLDKPLLELLWGTESKYLVEDKYAEPALFAIQYSIYKLWQSWGITPQALLGDGVGEYVTACIAGVFSLEDGLKLIATRAALKQERTDKDIFADKFKALLKQILLKKPNIELISILTGNVVDKDGNSVAANKDNESYNITSAEYWVKQAFASTELGIGIQTLIKSNVNNFLEIGPGTDLLDMAREFSAGMDDESPTLLSSIKDGQNEWQQILRSLCQLCVGGFKIDWAGFDSDYVREKVLLPTYPFQHKPYWLAANPLPFVNLKHRFLGDLLEYPEDPNVIIVKAIYEPTYSLISDHKINGNIVVSGAAHITHVIAAAKQILNLDGIQITAIDLQHPVVYGDKENAHIELTIHNEQSNQYRFTIYSYIAVDEEQHRHNWQKNLEGKFEVLDKALTAIEPIDIKALLERCGNELDVSRLCSYQQLTHYDYGNEYKYIERILIGANETITILHAAETTNETTNLPLHPGQVDCAFQTLINLALFNDTAHKDDRMLTLRSIGKFIFYKPGRGKLVCHSVFKSDAANNIASDLYKADINVYDMHGAKIFAAIDVVCANVTSGAGLDKNLHTE